MRGQRKDSKITAMNPSPRSSAKEARFYQALRDVFVGAKVEGKSGYINLMKIKSRYYENGVFPKLKQDIEKALEPFPDFRDELFDKLYTFFSRYFSESGSIYFCFTPLHQNVYEKVYTDDKDVILFWKTHMLYYVKTDRLFRNLEVELEGFKFFFDVSTLEHKKAMEKREIVYEFKTKRKDGTLVFNVSYSERGRKTRLDKILRELRKQGVRISEDVLERAFRVFEKQSEVDYFINKNAKAFLREQFDLWLYQYIFSGESEWTEIRIKQLQVLKDIAYKIIDFIAQFEDELVKIWNKPKFVLNSNYVITLDRIAERDMGLVERLLGHENFVSQVEEWKELGIVDDGFNEEDVIKRDLTGKTLNDKYRHLPIDTKYFKDLELEILGLFDHLDQALDGWLIKSENYQALNTILPKFREKVQTIYIDPPFNTGKDFDYVDRFQDSTWLTLMSNRLGLAKRFLDNRGSLFLHLDHNANYLGRMLLDDELGKEGFRNEIVWKRLTYKQTQVKGLGVIHDTILYFAKGDKPIWHDIRLGYSEEQLKKYFRWVETPEGINVRLTKRQLEGEEPCPQGRRFALNPLININPNRPNLKYEFLGFTRTWKYTREKMQEYYEKGIVFQPSPGSLPQKKQYLDESKGMKLNDLWLEVSAVMGGSRECWNFDTQKPEALLKTIIEMASDARGFIMDFFLGSGTTTAVAHKRGRKWIGIEMGDFFSEITLPRMKEVLAGKGNHEPCGISKEVKWQGGGFFKYYELEQYEDTLQKAKYEDADLFDDPYQDPYHQYVFMRDLKMLEALEVDLEQNKVKVDLSKLYDNIDIPETLSNLLGKWIKRIMPDFVEFEDGERVDIKNLDYRLIKPLIWW